MENDTMSDLEKVIRMLDCINTQLEILNDNLEKIAINTEGLTEAIYND